MSGYTPKWQSATLVGTDWGRMPEDKRQYRSGQMWRVNKDGRLYQLRGRFRRVGRKRAIWTRRGIKYRTPFRGRVIRGRGSYAWAVPYAGAALGGAMKGVGGYMGGAAGGTLSSLGGTVSRISGAGAYEVKSNSMLATDGSQVPYMHSSEETIRVRHREYLGDVYTSATPGEFSSMKYEINPGLDQVFPWGSQISQAFTEYTLLGMVVTFKSNSADALNSTNTNLGSIIMSANYNVNSPEFEGKNEMLNSMWAVTGKQSDSVILPIECDLSQMTYNNHYIRGGDMRANEDRNMYDHCDVYVASHGAQGASVNIGEIWISYDIELRKPRANAALGRFLDTALFDSSGVVGMTGIFDGPMETIDDNIGISFPDHNTISFVAGSDGKYLISWWLNGATGTIVAPTHTLVNCESVNYNGAFDTVASQAGSVAAYTRSNMIRIIDSSKPATVSYTGGTYTGKTICGLIVTQVAERIGEP